MPYYRTFLSLLFVTGFAIGQTEIPGQERLPKTPVIDQDLANLADKISKEKNSHVSQFAKPKLSEQASSDPKLHKWAKEIADANNQAKDSQSEAAKSAIEQSQRPYELNSSDIERALATPDYAKFGTGGEYGDDGYMSAAMQKANEEAKTYKETRYGDDVYAYIAVSMSMPERWFTNMLASLANEHSDKRVVLALQGAKPGEFAKLALALEQSMPDDNKGSYAIVIDPTIFMRLDITKVPMFAINTEKGWRKVLGEMSLSQATAYALQDYDVFEALGRTYDIEEPNMITLLQERMSAQFENEDPVKKMRKKAVSAKPAIVDVPFSERRYSYVFTPIYTVEQDLTFEGTVFARKGDKVNTLEHLPLEDTYAFVDLSKPSHLALARKWLSAHPQLRIFSSTMPEAEKLKQFIGEFGYISQINQLMIDRFNIEAIPALAYQTGNQLTIEVEKHHEHLSKDNTNESD